MLSMHFSEVRTRLPHRMKYLGLILLIASAGAQWAENKRHEDMTWAEKTQLFEARQQVIDAEQHFAIVEREIREAHGQSKNVDVEIYGDGVIVVSN
jgi:hypothetical protein